MTAAPEKKEARPMGAKQEFGNWENYMCGTYIGYRRYLRESSINHGLIQFVPFLFLRLRSLAEAMSDVMHRGEKRRRRR